MTQEEIKKANLNKRYEEAVKKSQIIPKPEFLSVELAEKLLNSKFRNRPINRDRVEAYKQQIIAGEWLMDGHSIQISNKGNLLNGWHTCIAIVETGVGIGVNIVRNVPEPTFVVMDVGGVRTLTDNFSIFEISNPKATSAACSFYHRYRLFGRFLHNKKRRPTVKQALEIAKENPAIIESVEFCNKKALIRLVGLGLISFCHFVCSQKSRRKADEFFTHLMNGDNLEIDSPIRVLREKLYKEKMSRASTPAHDIAVFIFKAWNAFREGRPLPRGAFKRDLDMIPEVK